MNSKKSQGVIFKPNAILNG